MMAKARPVRGWTFLINASVVGLLLGSVACGRLSGSASSTDDSASAVATVPPLPTSTARRQTTPSASAHIGAIAQTLSLMGRVAAQEQTPLSFEEAGRVGSVGVKAGQSVDAGQVLLTADPTDFQKQLDAAEAKLQTDSTALSRAQQQVAAQQLAAQRQAQAAQAAQAAQVAQAQAALDAAQATLQKVQAGPSAADVQAAQNAVTAAQIQARKAEADQQQIENGPDPTQVRAAEQELATQQAAVAKAQADLDALGGAPAQDSTNASASGRGGQFAMTDISPGPVSTDAGHPSNNYGFQAIAVDPNNPQVVYVGTSYQGLWKSSDGGQSWSKINTGTNGGALDSGRLWTIAIDPTNTRVMYTAPGYGAGGIWKSTDGGVNWTALLPVSSPVVQQLGGEVPTPSNIAIDPSDHQHLIASSHFPWKGSFSSANGTGVLESKDGGATWIAHAPVQDSGAEHQVAFLGDSSTWIESQGDHGLYRTTDAGATWSKVADTGGEAQNTLNVDGTFYVPAAGGVLRSTDNGATWQVTNARGLAIVSDGVNLYTAEATTGSQANPQGMFYSPVSDGTKWLPYSDQTMCRASTSTCDGPGWMAYDAADHVIYASSWLAGVWKLQPGQAPAPTTTASTKGGAQPNAADVAAAQQRLQAAKDAVGVARAKLQSLTAGPDQNALDTAQLAVDTAHAAVDAAQAKLAQLQAGPSAADLKTARDAVATAQANLNRARAGGTDNQDTTTPADPGPDLDALQQAVDNDTGTISWLEDRITATQLTAPFAGTVVSVALKAGDPIDPNKPAVVLARPGDPVVKATITPSDLDKVSTGQSVIIELPGQSDSDAGINASIASLANSDTGAAKVATIQVPWGSTPPKLGTVLDVEVVLQEKSDALIVPKKAVHTVGTRTFVEVLNGSTRKATTVQLGIVGSTDAEIVSGLAQGDLVVVGP